MRHSCIALLLVLLAGCGGEPAERPERTPAATEAPAATAEPAPDEPAKLVTVQRNGGFSATLDLLTVNRDGTGTLDKRYGGAGRRTHDLRLTPERLRAIRRALRELPKGSGREGADPMRVTFILRAGGRTYTAQQGSMTRRERPLFRLLDGVIGGSGRG